MPVSLGVYRLRSWVCSLTPYLHQSKPRLKGYRSDKHRNQEYFSEMFRGVFLYADADTKKKRHSRFLRNTPKNFCEKLRPSAQISDFFSHIKNLLRIGLQIFRPFSDQLQTVFSRNSCFLPLLLCLHSSFGSLFLLLCRKH